MKNNLINKETISKDWYVEIILFLNEAKFVKMGRYWYCSENFVDNMNLKEIKKSIFFTRDKLFDNRKNISVNIVKIDIFILNRCIAFWKKTYETKWITNRVDEMKVYRCEYFNPTLNEVQFRPCVFKYINSIDNQVMIFFFSSREKNENEKYAIKVNEISSLNHPNGYFVNTWTKVKNIENIIIQDFKKKDNDVFISKSTFFEMLTSLQNALKQPNIRNSMLKDLTKFESIIRKWRWEYKK